MKNPFIASKVAKTQRENGHYDRLRKQLLGKPRSEETKKKMSNSLKGRKAWNKGKKGVQIGWLKGKHPSSEAIRKMIETRMKNNSYYHSEKTRKKMSLSSFGKPKSEEHRKAIKEARKKRIMPKIDTSIEVKIQNFLKQLGISFLTHQYIEQIEHGYQCDILIPSLNLVIECDGDYWHKYPIGKELDSVRTSELLQKGFKVLRLWEHEIKKMNIDEFKFKLEDKK